MIDPLAVDEDALAKRGMALAAGRRRRDSPVTARPAGGRNGFGGAAMAMMTSDGDGDGSLVTVVAAMAVGHLDRSGGVTTVMPA